MPDPRVQMYGVVASFTREGADMHGEMAPKDTLSALPCLLQIGAMICSRGGMYYVAILQPECTNMS